MKAESEDLLSRIIAGSALGIFLIFLYLRYQQWRGEFGTAGTILCSTAACCICLFAIFGPRKWRRSRPAQNTELFLLWGMLAALSFLGHRSGIEPYLYHLWRLRSRLWPSQSS